MNSLNEEFAEDSALISHILACSCLGNPLERGAWLAAVHGIVKELGRTKQLQLEDLLRPGMKFSNVCLIAAL